MTRTAIPWRLWDGEAFAASRASCRPLLVWLEPSWAEGEAVLTRAALEEGPLGALIGARFIPVLADPDAHGEVGLRYGLSAFPAALVLSPEGEPLVRLTQPTGHGLRQALESIATAVASSDSPSRGRVDRGLLPFVPPAPRHLERGLEALEGIWARVERSLSAEAVVVLPPRSQIESLRFLIKHAAFTGERRGIERAAAHLQALARSPLYDMGEGGFFGGMGATGPLRFKRLRDNAGWLLVSLGLSLEPEAPFARPLSQGILRCLHNRFLLEGGGFANSLREEARLGRRARGARPAPDTPGVDRTLYSEPNALAVQALCGGWLALGDPTSLQGALDAFETLRAVIESPDGKLAHGFAGASFGRGTLEDAVEMGMAYLDLYHATLEPEYLEGLGRVAALLGTFRNPAGEGFLDLALVEAPDGLPQRPVVDPSLNARAANFLILASAQLEDEALAVPARGILGALLASPLDDFGAASLVGSALLTALFPLATYEAITDGSGEQRRKVLDRIRQTGARASVITHRLPGPREGMQQLPRLVGRCGTQLVEIVV